MAEKLFTREFVFVTCISMCCSMNYFTLLISMTGFATISFGASTSEAGLAAGLYVIGGLLSRIFLGKYIELIGRKRMLVVALFFSLIMSAMYFFVNSLAILCLVRLLHGLGFGVSSTCATDIIAKLVPRERRGEGLGYYLLGVTISMAIGPFLGMVFSTGGNYDAVFAVGLSMYLIALMMAVTLRIPEEDLTDDEKREARSFNIRSIIQIGAVPLAITCMVFYFGYSGVLSFISEYTEDIGLVEAATYFYLIVAAGTFVSRLTTGKIYDRRGPNLIISLGYISFVIGMMIFSQIDTSLMLLFSGFFIGYGISIVFNICQAIVITQSTAQKYGLTTSTFSAIVDMGSGTGPMILGLVIPLLGFRDMYLACAVLGLVSLMMYWLIHGRKAHEQEPMRELK